MRYLVAVPVFNEQHHVLRVLDAVARYCPDILVIDDGSTDRTPALLARRPDVAVITHRENRGYGQSVIEAFHYAAYCDYDWVITMDCDEQHEPEQIPEFLACMQPDAADVISGSRYLQSFPDDDPAPPERRQINHTINLILAQVLGLELTDSFCGFKAHRVAAMQRLALDEPGYAFPLQFWTQCVRAGMRVVEIPVRRIYRDRSRQFGGTLDDPAARLHHYLEVFVRELRRDAVTPAHETRVGVCCCTRSR
jgi:glycosyltransferase involved in cell wall biosynthesis